MASIIKVDTIQTAAGGTPTAADLGLNTTGSVLQVVQSTLATSVDLSNTSDVLMFSGTITPSSANSKILIDFVGNFRGLSGGSSTFLLTFYDGATLVVGQENGTDSSGSNSFDTAVTKYLYSPATTSPITIDIKFKAFVGTDVYRFFGESASSSQKRKTLLTLTEIAG